MPVGAERHTRHRAGVAGERGAEGLAGVGVPQPHRAVAAGGGQPVPVGAERHTGHRAGVAGERVRRRVGRCRRSTAAPCRRRWRVASRCPSGLNATLFTAPVWPVSGAPTGWPVSAFHSRTVPSPLALASRCPSGLNATPSHRAGVAGERVAEGLAGVGVPQPHRAVVAGAGQPVPVGAERHTRSPRRCGRSAGCRRVGRCRRSTAAPCCRRWRWPAGARRG